MSSRALSTFKNLLILTAYRHRVIEGVLQDIRQRYIGSIFGSFWLFIFPIGQLGIYAVVYALIFKIRVPGLTQMGYVLLIFSGLVPLMAFNLALTAATSSLSSNKNLLLNTIFPAELIPVRAALSGHMISLVGLVITLILSAVIGRLSWEALIFIPIFWIILLMFAIGLGWILSLLSLVARDIQHGLGLAMILITILSPFAYTPEMVPASLRAIIYFNPMSYFVLSFQKLICYGELPNTFDAFGALFIGISCFFTGFSIFQRAKYVFFDYA